MAEENVETKVDKAAERQKTSTEKASEVIKQRDTIRSQRSVYEKQWLVNIAFLHGKQYFDIEKKSTAGLEERISWEISNQERKKKTRRTDNYILPLYRSQLTRLLSMKSNITVDATTGSDRDKASATVGQEVLEDHWQMVNKRNPILSQDYAGMMLILAKLFGYLITTGTAYLKPYFNPKTKSKTYLNGKIIDAEIGEVETRVKHIFDIFKDPLKRYIIEQSIYGVDEIEDMYNEKVSSEDVSYSETEQKLITMLEGSTPEKFENAARLFEKTIVPCKKYPNGLYQVCTAKKVLYEGDIPPEYKGRIPYFQFTYLDLMLSAFAQGMVDQLISHQEDINNTISKLAAYKKWFAGKIMVPDGADLQTKWDDEVGQMIIYKQGNKPTQETPPSPPQFLMLDIARSKKSMEDIAGAHDASMGRVPNQVKSGVAINSLSEVDSSQLAPTLIGIEQQLSFYGETVLDIVEVKYTEPRLLSITGEVIGAEVRTFKGEQVSGNRRIKISMGSGLPTSKGERQQFIMVLEKQGYITKEKARELMEFGDLEGIFHTLDENLQKEENQMLLRPDYGVTVEPWDDHTIHAKIVTDFMKTKQYMELPQEMRQKFIEHRQQHLEALSKEHEAQATMQARAASAARGAMQPQPQPR